jgi:hypothetical protein
MNLDQVKEIAAAVLYEGYLLYPYRRSALKNRQRWTFGVLYPREFSATSGGTEPWTMRTECLVQGRDETRVEITVGFLQLLQRGVVQTAANAGAEPRVATDGAAWSPATRVADQSWEEGVEREVRLSPHTLRELVAAPRRVAIAVDAASLLERDGDAPGTLLAHARQALAGAVTVAATPVDAAHPGVFKLSVLIENTTPLDDAVVARHDAALPHSFVSTHTILRVRDGAFVSLLEPPDALQGAAANCHNERTWPVLVGDAGDRDTLLSSPIILYDYPQIAPESPGALFDGTEIDEILTLRILALSDAEKAEIRQGDARARDILERTESLSAEQMWKLHGVIRDLSPGPSPTWGGEAEGAGGQSVAPTDGRSGEAEGAGGQPMAPMEHGGHG